MHSVKILACVPKSKFVPFSTLIRLVQKTPYSHYAIHYGDYVLDSTLEGVVWNPQDKFYRKYKIHKSWDFHIKEPGRIFGWSAKYSARPYSIMQNIGAGLKWIGLISSNPYGNDEYQLNCAELICLWCRDFLGSKLEDSDNYDLIKTEILLDTEMENVSNSQ